MLKIDRLAFATQSLLLFSIFCTHVSTAASETRSNIHFNRDIRPILANHCFECHGPSEKDRQADLRLDQEAGVRAMFGTNKFEIAKAWRRINSDDPEQRMPPPDSHKMLKPDEIDLIRQWIDTGAKWQGHWSFLPPSQPPVPKVQNTNWPRNPIDKFVLARMEQAGLHPSPEADRERLLRRVTFDLTGLPPSIEEIDAFLSDNQSDAYERIVDRLLDSNHFGERMALAWMDAARYGDSSVFHADGRRDMWAWRDWVIDAYNNNQPFDLFTVEQLAGDLLPNPTIKQQIATGFNRNNATTDEGGAIPEEYRVEYAVDRVKTTSMVWLGLTMECGQCHDHKYDPISQRDYYQFFAYFNQASDPGIQIRSGNQNPIVDVPDFLGPKKQPKLEAELEKIDQQLVQLAIDAESDFQSWLVKSSKSPNEVASVPTDMLLQYRLDETEGDQVQSSTNPVGQGKVTGNPQWVAGHLDQAFQFDGMTFIDLGNVANFERTDSFSYGAWIRPQGKGSGAPLAKMDDAHGYRGYDLFLKDGKVEVHLIHLWPGNSLLVTTVTVLKPDEWQHVMVTYDGSSKAQGIQVYFDGQAQIVDIEKDSLADSIRTEKPLHLGQRDQSEAFQGQLDDVQFFSRELTPDEVLTIANHDFVTSIVALPPDQRTDQQLEKLRNYSSAKHNPAYRQLQTIRKKINKQIVTMSDPVTTVMVMKDLAEPRMTYILDRGNYASPKKDQPVDPGVPNILPPLPPDAPSNRLGMAQWLVQSDHPLTSRVTVNRYWYMLFGTGIVETVEDFGSQGQWPSHPDLLDWLAVDFAERGWNIKQTLKQMVMSATYRQSSSVRQKQMQLDPQNRLLSRGPRFRLQGEFVRDGALAASGLLVDTIGGPSVRPYQPPGLWNEVSLEANVRFVQDHGESLYRRSMYIYWKRSAPAPSMTIFDAPSRESCAIRRSRTNTPLQALVTLNDPQFVEAAHQLAQRVMETRNSLDEQIILAYRLATGVHPSSTIQSILKQSFMEELVVFQAHPKRALQLLSIGETKRNEQLDTATHAAMAIVTSMILNLDATLTRG